MAEIEGPLCANLDAPEQTFCDLPGSDGGGGRGGSTTCLADAPNCSSASFRRARCPSLRLQLHTFSVMMSASKILEASMFPSQQFSGQHNGGTGCWDPSITLQCHSSKGHVRIGRQFPFIRHRRPDLALRPRLQPTAMMLKLCND